MYCCNVQSMHAYTDTHITCSWRYDGTVSCKSTLPLSKDWLCVYDNLQWSLHFSPVGKIAFSLPETLALTYFHCIDMNEMSRVVSHCNLASLPPLSPGPPSPPPYHGSVVAAESDHGVQLKHLLSTTSDTSVGVHTPQYDATLTWAWPSSQPVTR